MLKDFLRFAHKFLCHLLSFVEYSSEIHFFIKVLTIEIDYFIINRVLGNPIDDHWKGFYASQMI